MEKRRLLEAVYGVLKREYPDAPSFLHYRNPFELMVAVILSAQTTDARVNTVTSELFSRYPGAAELMAAEREEVERYVFSTGFYRVKAKNIMGAAKAVVERYGGVVPETMDALLHIPGVGRKSANVIRAHCFGKPAIIVDTHFSRVVRRIGLTEEKVPEKIERDLALLAEPGIQTEFSMVINIHGRRICSAKKPDCRGCVVRRYCLNCRR